MRNKKIIPPARLLASLLVTNVLFFLCYSPIKMIHGMNVVGQAVSDLLKEEEGCIELLKAFTRQHSSKPPMEELPFRNDVFYLRYCLEVGTSEQERVDRLTKTLEWRDTDRGRIVTRNARQAYEKATTTKTMSCGDVQEEEEEEHCRRPWNNTPVQEFLPHYPDIFQTYLSSDQVMTTSSHRGDLLYMIRSRAIQDKELMNSLTEARRDDDGASNNKNNSTTTITTPEELAYLDMVDWFMYAKEVNSLLAHERSVQTDRLTFIITLNDLHGTGMMGGGDARFQKALKESGTLGKTYCASTFGPIVLLNLPKWLGGLASFFAPSSASIQFHHGPLKDSPTLSEIAMDGSIHRNKVMEYLNEKIYT